MIGSLWLLSKHLYLGLLFVQPLFRKKNKQSIHKFSLFNEPRLRPTNHRAVNGGASLYSITWHHQMELRSICCSAADANGGRQPEHDLLLKVVLQAGRSPPHQTPPPTPCDGCCSSGSVSWESGCDSLPLDHYLMKVHGQTYINLPLRIDLPFQLVSFFTKPGYL